MSNRILKFILVLFLAGQIHAQDWSTAHSKVEAPKTHKVQLPKADTLKINTNVALPAAINQAARNVVVIHAPVGGGQANKGSGTYVGNRLVITAAHVTVGVRNIRCTFPLDGQIQGTLIGEDRQWDVALVYLDKEPRQAKGCKLASRNIVQGTKVFVCGYSQGELLIRAGMFRAHKMSRSGSQYDWVEVSTPSWPGDSGGAFLLEDGSFAGPLWGSNFTSHTIGTNRGRLGQILSGFG